MAIELRPINAGEIRAFFAHGSIAFGEDLDPDDAGLEARVLATLPLDRTYAAFDGDTMVGTGGEYPLSVVVPGGAALPASGLTQVSVSPTHTRRGVLTSMMERHYRSARDRGEALGALWASQSGIYRRFGYGVAVDRYEMACDTRLVGPLSSPDGIELRTLDAAPAELPAAVAPVWQAALRPGMLTRSPAWWEHHLLYDPPAWREGATAVRCAVATEAGTAVGYVLYRLRRHWEGAIPEGTVDIVELIATHDRARRALWAYVTRIDLFPMVRYWNLPADDPLRWEVADARQLKLQGPVDGLWIRLISVADALPARSYLGDGRVTLAVADESCPWNEGTFTLDVSGSEAECRASDADPQVWIDVSALGDLYLGGRSAPSLARAGLIEGSPEAIGQLDALFRWPEAPWCPEVF